MYDGYASYAAKNHGYDVAMSSRWLASVQRISCHPGLSARICSCQRKLNMSFGKPSSRQLWCRIIGRAAPVAPSDAAAAGGDGGGGECGGAGTSAELAPLSLPAVTGRRLQR